MKFVKKGNFGYIKSQRTIEMFKTALFLCTSIVLYQIGVRTTGSNQNIMTLFAVLGCLPMAKFCVNFIMFLKAKGCSKELKEKLDAKSLEPLFYDLYFTAFKKNYQVSALYYKKKNLIMISEDKDIPVNEAEEHIRTILENCGIKDICIKIFTDDNKFIDRLCELKNLEEENKDLSVLKDNILSVSL